MSDVSPAKEAPVIPEDASSEKKTDGSRPSSYDENIDHEVEVAIEEKSYGVLKAEILAAQWQKGWQKVILLISAFLVGYAYGLDGQTRYIYNGYATGNFNEHSLLATINVITGFIGAGFQPLYARLSDYFGRLELFIVSILFYVVGTIIQSQAYDVNRYAAGDVFYNIGYVGAIFVLLLILSDFSSLRWRLFFNFVPAFPFIINTWISGNVTSAIGFHWSWGIGMWAFIYPLACIPLLCCMIFMRWQAGKTEEWKVFKQKKTKFQELGFSKFMVFLFWKLDVLGILLLEIALGCFLVPITLAGGVNNTWRSGKILGPFILGFLLFPVFLAWEVYGAKFPVVPFNLVKDRGVWSALVISFLYDAIYAVEASYMYAVLIVAVNESQKSATRITSLFSFVSTVGGFFFGLFIVYFKKLKVFIIFGVALWFVAFGILIHFRGGHASHSGIIGGLCVLGFGATFFTYPLSVSVMSSVSHEHMAVIVGVVYMLFRVGYAVGSAIAAAVWTNHLYPDLRKALNNDTLAASIYGDPYTFAATNPWGTPLRDTVSEVYQRIQKILMIICICLCVPALICSFFLRDHKLGKSQAYDGVEELANEESIMDYVKTKLSNPFSRTDKFDITEKNAVNDTVVASEKHVDGRV